MPGKYLFFILIALTGLGCGTNTEHSKQFPLEEPSEKIWAHRFNTLDNAQERLAEFEGIEIDIYYLPEANSFHVKHDKDSTGIELEFFLDSILKIKPVKIWFDYKNLHEKPHYGIDLLTELIDERKLQDRCLVESSYPNELRLFNSRIATSFWISYAEIPHAKKERDQLFNDRYANIHKHKVTSLSTSFEMFDFMQEYFPERNCNYWMNGNLDDEQIALLAKMANSPNVRVILIDGNTNLLK